ncbi:MAG: diaminopimelate decarboxylase [Clostridiales bacterium]|nr:diaminopimelate decarboxylase [Clostridiales bacterium]
MKEIYTIKNGELYIEDLSAAELARRFGTPLYVYSKQAVTERCGEIRETFLERYPGRAHASYASKAFLTPLFARLIAEQGLSLDVVSGGELYTAMRGGFPTERIAFHGNNKTIEEMEAAVDAGVGRIIVDALDEIDLLEEICPRYGRVQPVLFRITPEVKAGAHDAIQTGHRGSKFGIPMEEHILYPLIERAIHSPQVEFRGLHFHIGSQLFEAAPYLEALDHVLAAALEIRRRFGYSVPELVIGGGFGARYTDEERLPYAGFLDPVMARVRAWREENAFEPELCVGIEPGRSIVAEAGVTLYTVGSVKETPGGPKYVSVDGGMSDNIRPALYGAKYAATIANKAGELPDDVVTVCGKLCESGDRLIDGARLQCAARGDILCVFSTGAYGYSMANNYNKIPRPAVVLADGKDAQLLARRETYADMIACENM